APMTSLLLYWLAAADPETPPAAGHTFSRAGVTCSESVAPPAVPLTGEVRLTLTAEGESPLAVEPVTYPDPPGWRVRATVPAGGRLRPPAPEPPPVEWATAELDRLAGLDPAAPSTADALAVLLRGFLTRRYQLPAAGKTTAEVVAVLGPLPPESVAGWQSLLE